MRRILRGAAWTCAALLLCAAAAWQAVVHPATPLPPQWNPLAPLAVAHPVTPFTGWKLRRVLADGALCRAVLTEAGAGFETLPDREESAVCHIRDRVRLARIGEVRIRPLDTRCQIALRLAMWTEHGLRPAADELGMALDGIEHLSSFSCRRIRSPQGDSGRMSLHATADAVDIAGFRLADGARIRLIEDWDGDAARRAFLRAARSTACDWFPTVLGPDYNRLHADHFHLQHRGWGTCR